MKTLLLIFLSSLAFAGGPRYGYSDPKLDDEMNNIYKDIKNVFSKGIRGTTTNDNADSGVVGEYVESVVGSGGVGTTLQFFDITSISLTPGDWDVSGSVVYIRNGASWVDLEAGISSTSGNSSTGLVTGSNLSVIISALPSTIYNYHTLIIPSYRVSLNTTTTIYLKGYVEYTVATPNRLGRISARRVR